jgi:hypothetical protein
MLLVLWAGCGLFPDRGDAPAIPPAQKYLEAPDQTLPAGRVGEPYSANVQVTGGDPPYTWTIADGDKKDVPQGLDVLDDGTVTGVPVEAGDFLFAMIAHDSVGREKRTQVALQIVLEPEIVRCGDTVSGTFFGSAVSSGSPDLSDVDGIEWLAIEMPDDLTSRIELVFHNDLTTSLYITRPGSVAGSWNLADDYVEKYLNPGYSDMTVTLDAGTDPSLTGYLTEPVIPMLLVPYSSGDWSVDIVCTDGPIISRLATYPTELGAEMDYDFNVYGDQDGISIYPLEPDELPEWMIWDSSTGTVTGTALEAGAWEFTIVAEAADGRRREERSILGVYAVADVACGDIVDVIVEEGYFDGEFLAFYDPKGFRVYRLAIEEGTDVSGVELVASGSDGQYLGLAAADPDFFKFYGGAERLYDPSNETVITVDTRSYPAIGHYEKFGELYFSAGTLGSDTDETTLEIVCDDAPRVETAGLPVFSPLVAASTLLTARGGVDPYTFSATGLPSGVTLSPDGTLAGTTGAVGTYDVTITVTDKLGDEGSESFAFYVGHDEACAGYTRVSCNDSIDGEFESAYYTDGSGPDSTAVFCIVDDGSWLGWEVYADNGELRVDIADPGVSADDMFDFGLGTNIAYIPRDTVAGIGIDPFSWPDLDDYSGMPVLFALRAYDPGSWTAHLTCQSQ